MDRYYQMTKKAQQVLWSNLSTDTAHIPTQFLIEGDSKDGYRLLHVNDDKCGFVMIDKIDKMGLSLGFLEDVIDTLNESGNVSPLVRKLLTVGTMAWASFPMPQIKCTSHPMDAEDQEIIEQNERFLWDHINTMATALKDGDKWEQFKTLVGEEIAMNTLIIIDQGPDPRMPA